MLNNVFIAAMLLILRLKLYLKIIDDGLHLNTADDCGYSRFADSGISYKYDSFFLFNLAILVPQQELFCQLYHDMVYRMLFLL